MKNSESSLFVVITLIFSIFLVFFEVIQLQKLGFSDPIIKKNLLLLLFISGLLVYAAFTNSLSKAFVLFYPFLFELDRPLLFVSDYLNVSRELKTTSVNLIDIIIITLFLILFDLKKVVYYFRFKPVFFYNLFILTGLATIAWAFSPSAAIAYIPTIILLPLAYYVFSRLFEFSERNIFFVSIGLLGSALFSIIFVWPSYFGVNWFSFLLSNDANNGGAVQGSVRAGGIVARAATALLLAGLIPFLYNFGVYYFKKYRRYVHAIGILLVFTLVLTLNRMHFAATCLCIALLLWYAIKQKVVKANIGFILVGGIAFLLAVVYIISLNGNDYEDTLDRSTWNGRVEQYGAAYDNFKYSMGMGIGMNNFLVSPISSSLLGTAGVSNDAFEEGNTVHDDYLRALCEYGVIGLLFYLLFFTSIIKIKSKDERMQALIRGGKISIFSFVLIGLSSPALNHNTSLILAGIYLAIIKYYKDKPSAEKFITITNKYM
jgi:O-antigen ligase